VPKIKLTDVQKTLQLQTMELNNAAGAELKRLEEQSRELQAAFEEIEKRSKARSAAVLTMVGNEHCVEIPTSARLMQDGDDVLIVWGEETKTPEAKPTAKKTRRKRSKA